MKTENANLKNKYHCEFGSLLPEEALVKILDATQATEKKETVSIHEALSRVLAEEIKSGIDVPSATNSAMDGYACRAEDINTQTAIKLVGTSLAGKPFAGELKANEGIRITTGAALPIGADTVIVQEQTQQKDGFLYCEAAIEKGANIRQAGEDIKQGESILGKGHYLTPAELGLLTSLGIGKVVVFQKIKVAFFSTGDELKSIGELLDVGMIYDSNRYTLFGMLARLGVEIIDLGVVRDTPEALEVTLKKATEEADVVISSGGVSVGDADYVKDVMAQIGHINFWKVAIKPGRPLAYGKLSNSDFFGLPGNPVSVMVTFYQFVQPALKKRMGITNGLMPLTFQVRCQSHLRKRAGRVEYQRGILKYTDGILTVYKTGKQGSGILRSMSEANCFIILSAERKDVATGEMVSVQPFFAII